MTLRKSKEDRLARQAEIIRVLLDARILPEPAPNAADERGTSTGRSSVGPAREPAETDTRAGARAAPLSPMILVPRLLDALGRGTVTLIENFTTRARSAYADFVNIGIVIPIERSGLEPSSSSPFAESFAFPFGRAGNLRLATRWSENQVRIDWQVVGTGTISAILAVEVESANQEWSPRVVATFAAAAGEAGTIELDSTELRVDPTAIRWRLRIAINPE